MPADHVGELVRTELGEVSATALGLPSGVRVTAVAIRAESLRARLCDDSAPGALRVRRVLELPERTHVFLDGTGLQLPVAGLGALVDDEAGAVPRPGQTVTVTLVGARTGVLCEERG